MFKLFEQNWNDLGKEILRKARFSDDKDRRRNLSAAGTLYCAQRKGLDFNSVCSFMLFILLAVLKIRLL